MEIALDTEAFIMKALFLSQIIPLRKYVGDVMPGPFALLLSLTKMATTLIMCTSVFI